MGAAARHSRGLSNDDFFVSVPAARVDDEPLASRMRPAALSEYVGQEHILGPGKLLRRAIESGKISSIILYGPPGTGKTTLAHVIAHEIKASFETLNAVTSGVAELRKILEKSKDRMLRTRGKTLLFIDEIHRFNKSQQDVLMPDVERGNPILIGATTYNPFFSIIPALLSRSLVFELKPLSINEIEMIIERAIQDPTRGLGKQPIRIEKDAMDFLCRTCDGDARRALNALEIGAITTQSIDGLIRFTLSVAEESIQKKAVVYDKNEDAHYDTISAFIKSMRGSDPDAAIYYLAKMLYAGEDPRFIARRILICASEDVGNADPEALGVALAAFQATEMLGMPEARIPLAQATTYVACAPKSNAAYLAIEEASADISSGRTLEVPDHLKDASYKGARSLGRGEGYKYAHDHEGHWVDQEYLTEERRYYRPTQQGREKDFAAYLEQIRTDARRAGPPAAAPPP